MEKESDRLTFLPEANVDFILRRPGRPHPHPPRSRAGWSRAGPSHSVRPSQLGHLSALEARHARLVRRLRSVRSGPQGT